MLSCRECKIKLNIYFNISVTCRAVSTVLGSFRSVYFILGPFRVVLDPDRVGSGSGPVGSGFVSVVRYTRVAVRYE